MSNNYRAYYDSPIGIVEITCSENGVTSLIFVDEEGESSELSSILKETIVQLDEYFKGTRKEFDLKLDLKGTDFQKSVWNELMKIPFGETCSYRELAVRLGRDKAVRAVGSANGRNKVSIIVPCHRVIGSDKKLTGYAWGLDRKQWLLEHESK